MNWPAYSIQKRSGVEWIDQLPTEWSVSTVAALRAEGADTFTDGDWIETPYITDTGVRLVQTGNIGTETYREQGFRYISEQTFEELQCKEVFTGDLLISRLGDPVGRSCIAPQLGVRMITSVDVCILRVGDTVLATYLNFVFNCDAYRNYVASLVRGSTRDRISRKMLGRFVVPVPDDESLIRIVGFLHRETAKIDALIDKQEQLIATLREDRAATINHAVTKGLNATAEWRESDVDWIGSIPDHWKIFKGTWIGTPFGSPAVPEEDVGTTGERAFLKVSSLSSSGFSPQDPEWFVSPSYRAVSDFVAFPKRGAAIFTNKVNVVNFPAVIDPNLMGWKMQPGHDAYYYAFIIGSLRLEEIADVSSVPQLNAKHIAGLHLPRPPVHEQREIVNYLFEQCKRIDALIDKSTEMIETLREYRSALITNAVTGKIDVREAV